MRPGGQFVSKSTIGYLYSSVPIGALVAQKGLPLFAGQSACRMVIHHGLLVLASIHPCHSLKTEPLFIFISLRHFFWVESCQQSSTYQYAVFFYLLNKDFNLKITLPGLEEGSQSLKIRLLPGNGLTSAVTIPFKKRFTPGQVHGMTSINVESMQNAHAIASAYKHLNRKWFKTIFSVNHH